MNRLVLLPPLLAAGFALACQAVPGGSRGPGHDGSRWLGADWQPNRIQDWERTETGVACRAAGPRQPARTCALRTAEIEAAAHRPFRLSVSIAAADGGSWRTGALAGVLLGAGGGGDPRVAALVHQAPAPGGGVFVGFDHAGRLVVKDFSVAQGGGNGWTIAAELDAEALPALGRAPAEHPAGPRRLQVAWNPEGGGILELADGAGAVLEVPMPRARVAGGISLFSSLGAEGSERGFRFERFRLEGATPRPERGRGPVIGVLYTLAERPDGAHALRLAAQLAAEAGRGFVHLEIEDEGGWRRVASARAEPGAWIARFELPRLELDRDRRFRLRPALGGAPARDFGGVLRRPPARGQAWRLALLSCVKHQVGPLRWDPRGLWYPHADLLADLLAQDPDLVFFAGDQIYEGDLTAAAGGDDALLDYHTKWERFFDSFGALTSTRPCVVTPDDHDVFHGNLWGAGGVRAVARDGLSAQDAGGYLMPREFVEAVHRTQTSHLPPRAPEIPERIGMGVPTYTTSFVFGGVDFAVLADRMWKDSPSVAAPAARFRNGWIQAEGFDPRDADPHGAALLGAEQEAFLARWGAERPPRAWTKVVLSQSPFACLHTLPAGSKSDEVVGRMEALAPGAWPPDDAPVADADSNGWPQGASRRARALLAAAGALHLAGDQHLATAVWYGVDGWRDGTVAFTGSAMANTWPRRWMPAAPARGAPPGAPPGIGDYEDGFGNLVTMLAVANPRVTGREPSLLHDRAPGYGVVRFDPAARTVTLEAWPRGADPHDSGGMSPGWPIRLGADGRPLPD